MEHSLRGAKGHSPIATESSQLIGLEQEPMGMIVTRPQSRQRKTALDKEKPL